MFWKLLQRSGFRQREIGLSGCRFWNWKSYQIRNGKDKEEAEDHMKRYGVGYFPLTIEAHLELMRKCGFQAVELIWMSYMQAGFMGVKLRSFVITCGDGYGTNIIAT